MDKVIKALLNTKRSAEAGSSAERLQKVDIRVQGAILRIIVQHDIKLLVISGGQFGNQYPGKEVKTGQAKMKEVVFFDVSPATYSCE